MKDGVLYPNIPYEEYRSRIDRAKKLLAEHSIDAMVLFAPVNWWYYGGFTDSAQMNTDLWRTVLIVFQDRDPVAIGDGNFISTFSYMCWVEDCRYHSAARDHSLHGLISTHSNFYDLLFDVLKENGLDKGTIGFETGSEISTYLCIDEFMMIKEKLPAARIVGADPVIWAQRMIKTPYEIDIIREGGRRACLCVRAGFETIRPGITEKEIHKAFWRKAVELDMIESPYQATWLCFSSNPSETLGGHRWITGAVDRIIKAGDVGHCDCGPTYKMYQYDFQRAFVVGKPSQTTIDYYNKGKEMYYETVDALKPGVRLGDLFGALKKAAKRVGFKDGQPNSFLGHGEGLDNHEPPWITADQDIVCEQGMVLAVEIAAFDTEAIGFGGMLEDLWLVTENGTENLTGNFTDEIFIAPVN